MKTLNVMLSNLGGRVVPIGYEGENLYTRVRINCIEVFAEYPDATVSMVVNPPDGNMYPAVVEKSGIMVVWDISDAVLSSSGSGECQLTFTDGDVVRKSVVFGISINRSLIASGEAPEPVQEWIDKAEQTAQEIAENAANLAKQDIVESYGSIAPAIIETASGAIASFSDGADGMLVKTLTVDIEPVQDLHGYDNPWPGGAGKNLFDIDNIGDDWVNTSNQIIHTNAAKSNIINVTGGTTLTLSCNIEATTNYVYLIAYLDSSDAVISRSVVTSGNKLTAVAGSNAVKAIAGVYNMDLTDAKIQVEVGSTNTAWSPYANVCPISGFTSTDVTRTGKNICDPSEIVSGGIDPDTGDISSTPIRVASGFIPVAEGKTYVTSIESGKKFVAYHFYGSNKENLSTSNITTNPYQAPTGASFVRVIFGKDDNAGISPSDVSQAQVEEGLTASAYEVYTDDTYTYPFPQEAGTVYGGTLTIRQDGTGTLVSNMAKKLVSEIVTSYQSANGLFYGTATGIKLPATASERNKGIQSSCFFPSETITIDSAMKNGSFLKRDTGAIYIRSTEYSTVESFNEAYGNQTILYELATPVTYQLTNQQVVSLLKGVNNVWADTGNVSLEYPADTKLYIDARVAELQALILENISNS